MILRRTISSILLPLAALSVFLFASCSKTTAIVSTTTLEFTSGASTKTITSTGGVILDDIRIDGKDISSHSQTSSGALVITGQWVSVTSPTARSGETVYSFLVSVAANNTSSTREAYVYVHDPSSGQIAKILVKQTCPADEAKADAEKDK